MTLSLTKERPQTSSYDHPSLRPLATPVDLYRCPVSTPINYQWCRDHTHLSRRHLSSQHLPAVNDSWGVSARFPRDVPVYCQTAPATVRRLDYYRMEKNSSSQTDQHMNGHWLRALCSQPVPEIINKYRSKSDNKRVKTPWSQTYTTPGEISLRHGWDSNAGRDRIKTSTTGVEPNCPTDKLLQANQINIDHKQQQAQRGKPVTKWLEEDISSGRKSPVQLSVDVTPLSIRADGTSDNFLRKKTTFPEVNRKSPLYADFKTRMAQRYPFLRNKQKKSYTTGPCPSPEPLE